MSKTKTRRPKGRRQQPLDHWPTVRQELIALIAELDHFPTLNELERRGRYDMMRAFVHHGGSAAVAHRLHTETEAATAAMAAPASTPPSA